jgi:hypothetical protein
MTSRMSMAAINAMPRWRRGGVVVMEIMSGYCW